MTVRRLELHVHSVLSACASLEMIPPFIIEKALDEKIDVIALTDHNTGANVPALLKAAEGTGITILPGMELETAEEIHVLCLFDTLAQLQAFEKIVEKNLPDYKNNDEFFGYQLVVDKHGNFLRKEERLLHTASRLSIFQAKKAVYELGGLFIPAHVEREENGMLPRLGGVPPELELEIVEISKHKVTAEVRALWSDLEGLHIIKNGDAHDLDAIVGTTSLEFDEITIANLKRAILEQC
jgi:PHP family Zn ribbon phosphoesterase